MSDSVRPHRCQPTRLPHPWGPSGKNTGLGCHFLFQCVKVKSESEVTQSCPTEHRRIDAFELWFWRRLLRVPWTARRSNQSILKEINPEYSLEGLMLKLQYFGHLMRRADLLKKTLMLGKNEGRRRSGQ